MSPADEALPAADLVIDLRGLHCPLPVLRARKALARMPAGACLLVEATDPLAAIDLPHFCREAGHAYLGRTDRDGVSAHLIRRGGGTG